MIDLGIKEIWAIKVVTSTAGHPVGREKVGQGSECLFSGIPSTAILSSWRGIGKERYPNLVPLFSSNVKSKTQDVIIHACLMNFCKSDLYCLNEHAPPAPVGSRSEGMAFQSPFLVPIFLSLFLLSLCIQWAPSDRLCWAGARELCLLASISKDISDSDFAAGDSTG